MSEPPLPSRRGAGQDPSAAAARSAVEHKEASLRHEARGGSAEEDQPPVIGPADVVVSQPEEIEEAEEMNPEFVRRWRPRISYAIRGSYDGGWQIDIHCRFQLPFSVWPDRIEIQKAILEALGIREVEI